MGFGSKWLCVKLPLVENFTEVVNGNELGIDAIVGCFVDGGGKKVDCM